MGMNFFLYLASDSLLWGISRTPRFDRLDKGYFMQKLVQRNCHLSICEKHYKIRFRVIVSFPLRINVEVEFEAYGD